MLTIVQHKRSRLAEINHYPLLKTSSEFCGSEKTTNIQAILAILAKFIR
ncbi:MAG: hypothetical protein ACI9LG_003423 [Moritella dasanensis]|jgi:hypothetical protein